jgi:hypothetical protein
MGVSTARVTIAIWMMEEDLSSHPFIIRIDLFFKTVLNPSHSIFSAIDLAPIRQIQNDRPVLLR